MDEIQECPNARTALKFLALDNRFDVIASGSLLGISYKQVTSYPVGYERQIEMYPLSFEEFLLAIGVKENDILYVKSFYDKLIQVEKGINDLMLNYFRMYLVIGGMPKVVNQFIQTKNYNDVSLEQRKIIDLNLNDISKYTKDSEKKNIKDAYLSIPKQLARENKKFKISEVNKSANKDVIRSSLSWLSDASLVHYCHNLSNVEIPLCRYSIDKEFKLYCNDTGLLIELGNNSSEIKQKIITNTLQGEAKGALYENAIANILIEKGYPLYYFKKPNNIQEIEFLITLDGITPVEVKAGANKVISLQNYINEHKPSKAYKFVNGNFGYYKDYITLPLYMSMFLPRFNYLVDDYIEIKKFPSH